MTNLTLTGTLNMLTAQIDWRDETARCVGVFRSDDHGALEVEYKVHLDREILDLLARAFLKVGIPVIRGSDAIVPGLKLVGDTLVESTKVKSYTMNGTKKEKPPKIDRRHTWRQERDQLKNLPNQPVSMPVILTDPENGNGN